MNHGSPAFDLDLLGFRVWREGMPIPLTRAEGAVLVCLARRPGHVIPRSDLLERAGIRGSRSLSVHVCRLRRKLNDWEGKYLETVRKVGYRLNLPALELPDLPELG